MARPARLSDPEIEARLARLPGWTRAGNAITRTFAFAGFPEAVDFIARLVEPAERMEHHPDIDLRYNKVIVTLSTHDQGGITGYDLDLAALVDGAVAG